MSTPVPTPVATRTTHSVSTGLWFIWLGLVEVVTSIGAIVFGWVSQARRSTTTPKRALTPMTTTASTPAAIVAPRPTRRPVLKSLSYTLILALALALVGFTVGHPYIEAAIAYVADVTNTSQTI